MAEWLSRQPRKLIPIGSPGSSPGGVGTIAPFFGLSMKKTLGSTFWCSFVPKPSSLSISEVKTSFNVIILASSPVGFGMSPDHDQHSFNVW